MSSINKVYLIVFLIYLAIMAFIGHYVSKKKVATYSDYLVAGRSMPFFVLVMTYAATGLGAGFTIGTVEKTASMGIMAALYPTAEATGSLVLALLVSKFMNKLGRDLELYTISQYLEIKYDSRMKAVSAIINAITASIIVGSQIIAGASIISIITGIDLWLTMWITGAVILYCKRRTVGSCVHRRITRRNCMAGYGSSVTACNKICWRMGYSKISSRPSPFFNKNWISS
jgi:SSS family solute:Na+ symporter